MSPAYRITELMRSAGKARRRITGVQLKAIVDWVGADAPADVRQLVMGLLWNVEIDAPHDFIAAEIKRLMNIENPEPPQENA